MKWTQNDTITQAARRRGLAGAPVCSMVGTVVAYLAPATLAKKLYVRRWGELL